MKKVYIILLSIFTILFFISCGSKPAKEEQKPSAPVVTDTVEDLSESVADEGLSEAARLAQLMEQINDARKAVDAIVNVSKEGRAAA